MEVLKKNYFDPKHPIAFAGVEKIYRWFKENGYKLSRTKIKNWLLKQEDYAIHQQPRRQFQRRRVISPYPGYMIDADLADYTSYWKSNDGFKYVLLCIDVFSRYVWAKALRNKTSKEMVSAFDELNKEGMSSEHVRTDKGKEFLVDMKNWFKPKHMNHFGTQNETKANYAERAIKTIKKKIARYMSFKQSHRWVDILEKAVYSYNHSYHRSIRMSPAQVTRKDISRLWSLQYEPKIVVKKSAQTAKPNRYKFKVGDIVRISALKRTFEREYDERFTRELFIVTNRQLAQGMTVYRLKDYEGENIAGTFYEKELVKAYESDSYKIEKVLRKRGKEVFVKWLGWPSKYDSWIPAADLKNYK